MPAKGTQKNTSKDGSEARARKTLADLFPSRRAVWVVAILLIAIVFLVYYLWLYHQLDRVLFRESELAGIRDIYPDSNLEITVRMPRFVADFDDQQLTIIAHNKGEHPEAATIAIQPALNSEAIVLMTRGEDGSLQTVAEFEEIPPFSSRRAVFLLRVLGGDGRDNRPVRLDFYFGTPPVPLDLTPMSADPVFSRLGLFQSVVARTLLLPPLANVVLPLVILLVCGFLEPLFLKGLKLDEVVEGTMRQDQKWLDRFEDLMPLLVTMLLIALGALIVVGGELYALIFVSGNIESSLILFLLFGIVDLLLFSLALLITEKLYSAFCCLTTKSLGLLRR